MMTPEPVPSETQLRKEQDERRKIIIALLFLLLAFSCIFCSSQSALWLIDRKQINASMLSARRAEYGSNAAIALAPLSGSIAAEANRDEEQLLLQQTPIAGGLGVVASLPLIEGLEYVRQIVLGNSSTAVNDGNVHICIAWRIRSPGIDYYPPVFASVFHRIGD